MRGEPSFEVGQYVFLSSRMAEPLETYEIVGQWDGAGKGTRAWVVRSPLGNEFPVLESEISRAPATDPCEIYRAA